MAAQMKLEHKAADKQGMTLDELAAFVQAAHRQGASGQERVSGEVTFGGKVKAVRLSIDQEARVQAG